PKQERGDDGPGAAFRPFCVARQYDEARGVVVLVLDVLRQDVEAVDFRGQPRGDGGAGLVAKLGDLARGARGVGGANRLGAKLADRSAALSPPRDVALVLHSV